MKPVTATDGDAMNVNDEGQQGMMMVTDLPSQNYEEVKNCQDAGLQDVQDKGAQTVGTGAHLDALLAETRRKHVALQQLTASLRSALHFAEQALSAGAH